MQMEYLTTLIDNCGYYIMSIQGIESETNKFLDKLIKRKDDAIGNIRLQNMIQNIYYIV